MAVRKGSARAIWALIPIFLTALALTLRQFTQPPQTLRPKVFVLGLSKTGTTSIGDALQRLGYRRLGWSDIRSRQLVHTWANEGAKPLLELTRYYDAFEDLPWPFVYKEMAERYPDAKFVLSLRENEETWLRSMSVHVGRGRWLPYTYFYGADTYPGNEDVMRHSYRNHTQNVRSYFHDKPERLVELNIDDGDVNWGVLCRVARCPGGKVPAIAFPRSNAAASWNVGFLGNTCQWLWSWLVTRLEEQSSYLYYSSGYEGLKTPLGTFWAIYDILEKVYTEVYFMVLPLVVPPLTVQNTQAVFAF